MDIVMMLLNNGLVQQALGLIGAVFVGGIGVWLWINSGLSNAVKGGGKPAGNMIGLFVWNNGVKNIKDDNLRKKIIEDLNTAGNDFDAGWDLGIQGIKI